MTVLISRQAPSAPALRSAVVQRMAERMLAHRNIESAELSILLTDDTTIHALNLEHRNKDKPTDVLSFPMMDPDDEQLATLEGGILGDVVISLDTAQRQARTHKQSLQAEVCHLLAHGLLHLLGYDHQSDREEHEMNAATDQLIISARIRGN